MMNWGVGGPKGSAKGVGSDRESTWSFLPLIGKTHPWFFLKKHEFFLGSALVRANLSVANTPHPFIFNFVNSVLVVC